MPNKPKEPYDASKLQQAIEAVQNKGWSINRCSKLFSVPRTTLYDRTRGRYQDGNIGKTGRKLSLDVETESVLVRYLQYMGTKGFPLTKKTLQVVTKQVVDKMRIKNPFGDHGPSRKWVRNFLKRHRRDLSLRTPDPIDVSRAALTQSDVDIFYDLVKNLCDDTNVQPQQIYNCDETGFTPKDVTKVKVIAKKGQKRAYMQKVQYTGHTTVMMCASAAGEVIPPYVIFEGSCPPDMEQSAPDNWKFQSTKSGWINTELFLDWFQNVFVENCTKVRPVILIMDNHVSHLSTSVIDVAEENNITLCCLPPHSSHILQPLDKGYFNLLKKAMGEMSLSLGYGGLRTVPKKFFAKILQFSMGKITSSAIKSAFRATGVYPPKRVLLCGASEDVGDVSEDVCADTDVSNPPCTECGKVLANKLIKLGIVPPYLADVLLPPPQQKPKKSNRARLSARVITRVSTESDKDVAISVPAHNVDCNIRELDISSVTIQY